jgi:transposase-like protein
MGWNRRIDARYERVREAGVISSQAVLIAIGIDWDGRRQVLAVELANRESRSSWRDFLLGLKARGLNDVEFVVADDHAGLWAALREALPEAAYQRCYVHFLRNALDYVPRRSSTIKASSQSVSLVARRCGRGWIGR